MSSKRQITANRENAKKSTGPITKAGKEVVSGNALRHGLMSSKPVVPHLESHEAWEEHFTATIAALSPQGHLEGLLAERVALLTWRLGRVVRYETESMALLQERAEEELQHSRFSNYGKTDVLELKKQQQETGEWFDMLTRLKNATHSDSIPSIEASRILSAICREVGISSHDPIDCEVPEYPGLGSIIWKMKPWTAGEIRDYATALIRKGEERIADAEGDAYVIRDFDMVWRQIFRYAQERYATALLKRELYEKQLDQWRRSKLLPAAPTLEKVSRYEAHLERSLFRTMQELRQLQEIRKG